MSPQQKNLSLDLSELNTADLLMKVPEQNWPSNEDILKKFNEIVNDPQPASAYRNVEILLHDWPKAKSLVDDWRQKFSTLLVLGTGGSSLGAKAVIEALPWECDRSVRFLENLDPTDMDFLATQDIAKTCVVAISKSGSTLETLSTLSHLEKLYALRKLDLAKHFAVITELNADPTLKPGKVNMLAEWATNRQVTLLQMHPNVGGRWSVSSIVGLFPIAFAGLNADDFFNAFKARFSQAPEKEILEFCKRLADFESANFNVHTLFVYSSRLKESCAWWRQLWSESLGKKSGALSKGTIAQMCVGSVDQHSVLQQLVEGRECNVTGFATLRKFPSELSPKLSQEFQSKLGFANGKSWSEILQAQAKATARSLQERKRPTYGIELAELNEQNLGEFFSFWMDTTAVTSVLAQTNAFDQPGVERGKVLTSEILSQ